MSALLDYGKEVVGYCAGRRAVEGRDLATERRRRLTHSRPPARRCFSIFFFFKKIQTVSVDTRVWLCCQMKGMFEKMLIDGLLLDEFY